MHGMNMQPWIDNWLSGQSRRWHLRFAANLEAAYERETGPERGRTLALYTLAGCVAYLFWDLTSGLSGIALPDRLLHAAVLVPVYLVMAGLLARGLPPLLREILASLLIISSSASLSVLYASGAWNSAGLSTTGVIISLMMAAQVIQLRFPFAVVSVLSMCAGQCAALVLMPPHANDRMVQYIETIALSAVIALLGNWRQERENRRAFLLALRERLGREALTLHNRELDDLARRDALTGLPNRRAFDAWLQTSLAADSADGAPRVSLIAIDIDHFKPYNDHYGHPAGDQCLRQVASCLREVTRPHTELVARIGGEEFAVLLTSPAAHEAQAVAEQLRLAVEALAVPHSAPGAGDHVTISAGVARAYVMENISLPTLAKRADAALYDAKQGGRNQVRMAVETT
jgi:diguanylate cyclase (GGDEF)-like protein